MALEKTTDGANSRIGRTLNFNAMIESEKKGASDDDFYELKELLNTRIYILNSSIKLHFKNPESIQNFKATLSSSTYNVITLGEGELEKAIIQNIQVLGSAINNSYRDDFCAIPKEKRIIESLSKSQQHEISHETDQELRKKCSISLAPKSFSIN